MASNTWKEEIIKKITDLCFLFKKVEKDEQINPKVSRKEIIIIKGRNQWNGMQTTENINIAKSWFLKNINKLLISSKTVQEKEEKIQITNIKENVFH